MSNAVSAIPAKLKFSYQQSEHQMMSWDGQQLFYRAWHPGCVRKKAVILFHGGHEHSGRFDELVQQLDIRGASVFAWDARGHGRSPGERGYANHFHDLVRDADAFVRHISNAYDIAMEDMALLGHSVGSVIISTWLHDYAPPVRAAVLGSPAFNVKLYAPFALPALKLWQKIKPRSFVNSYVKPGMLTHDTEEAEARRNDPLISPEIAVRVLTSLYDTADRVIAGAKSIQTPILLLSAGDDWVVHRSAQQRFFDRLGSRQKQMKTFAGFFHEIFHEKHRDQAIALAKDFLERHLAGQSVSGREVLSQGEDGFKALAQPLPLLSVKGLYYATTRFLLNSVGRLSAGIRLGWRTGFDSGSTLDYVYRNKAEGHTSLGRFLDRLYLNAVGWQGIRQRGETLQQTLDAITRRLAMKGERVHILDVASGPGRYVLNTIAGSRHDNISATCRDWDERGLVQGRNLAQSMGLCQVQYERANAFAPESYDNLSVAPNIVIVSGLYELFDDNALIETSLRAIYQAMPDNACLIYTNQPHHPQLELIARTLINRDGQSWVMRLRSQGEMQQLVRAAGFKPMSTQIDDWGIFSVNVAVKKVS